MNVYHYYEYRLNSGTNLPLVKYWDVAENGPEEYAGGVIPEIKNGAGCQLTVVIRCSVQFEILALASKYRLDTVQNSKSMVKDAIWTCFEHKIDLVIFSRFCGTVSMKANYMLYTARVT